MTVPEPSPLLEAAGVTKVFPGVRALDGVEFAVQAGEIHALLGENGAGKSTLIKVLTGVYPRDAGAIRLAGRTVHPRSPADAESLGISTVYQEIHLLPALSVAENILLGRQPGRAGWIRWRELHARAGAALERVGLGALDPRTPAGSCSLAVQQLVAIARALDVQARVLILDEPTSSLDEREVEQLFVLMRRLRGEGLGVVFVTHFLDQVYAVCDRITVLRNGALVGSWEAASLPRLELVARMLGRDPGPPPEAEAASDGGGASGGAPPAGPVFLEARGLARRGALHPLDLAIRRGEPVGLAGLLGSGRTETARLLFGADRRTGGTVTIEGRPAPLRSPREAIARGIAFCSEDRRHEGIVPSLSVRENLVLALQGARGALRRLPRGEQDALAGRFIRSLNIKTPSPEAPVGTLSGGNQQKVLLARWLCLEPRLFLLDEPTRGIDVGAREEIERLIGGLCRGGSAVLFISSELEEVLRVCRRVAVLRDRRKAGELSGPELNSATVLHTIARAGEPAPIPPSP